MASISISIPDTVVARVLDAFAEVYGYTATDGTKAQFARSKLVEYVRGVVRSYEVQQASEAAAQAAVEALGLEGIN